MGPDQPHAEPGVARAALTCRCPRCGQGKLFSGWIMVAPRCTVCGLDLSRVDTGDGFVVPILMVLGAMIVGGALWLDFTFEPPLWVHALIWPPLIVVLALVMTRYLKSFLAVQQYHVRKSEMGV
jgi:uncharacterized protein (DUF983 family)